MKVFKDLVSKMLLVQVVGIAGMLLAGWILAAIQKGYFCSQQSFFTYRIQHLDQTPAWFVFVLLQLAINGFWLFRLAVVEGALVTPTNSPYGNWGIQMPINYLRVFAVNLVVIPTSLFAFMLIRHAGW